LKFVLAITTFNRLEYLKKCIDSFFETRSEIVSWHIIIADDNSTDGTKEYLESLEVNHGITIIHNDRTNIHQQVNSIFDVISEVSFDLCFRCDDDVYFLQKGWDILYWETIERTGYDHLIYYDKNWQPYKNLSRPIKYGDLVANCSASNIQGALYTITRKVLDTVGYFDVQQFGPAGLGHVDFSLRCCRAGFNVLSSPFDIRNSNDYIRLQSIDEYKSALKSKNKTSIDSKELKKKMTLLNMDRIFVPRSENIQSDKHVSQKNKLELYSWQKSNSSKHQKADATFYSDRGLSGIVGFVTKKIYNLSIDLKLYFIPKSIKKMGALLNKISIHLLNIEQ